MVWIKIILDTFLSGICSDGSNYQPTNVWVGGKIVQATKVLSCFRHLCFSFLCSLSHSLRDLSSLDIRSNVLGLSSCTYVEPFLLDLISFENKPQHNIPILKGGSTILAFFMVLKSQVPCVTLNIFGQQLAAFQTTCMCYYTKWCTVCLTGFMSECRL